MPLFTTGDDNIYESEVILQYILDKYADVGMNVGVSLSLSLFLSGCEVINSN